MDAIKRKIALSNLIDEYNKFKKVNSAELNSEETIRTWLNQFLAIFDWDVRDTAQILQEKVLSKTEKEKLKEIGSTNTRPDYIFKIAKQKLTFLDAKDITTKIKDDKVAAFQIKSYGWSISAPCAFISNFEEFAIYDCTYTPVESQETNLGRVYLTIDEYLAKYDILETHLLKENIYRGKLNQIYANSLLSNSFIEKITLDLKFAEQLSNFRLQLANNILENNPTYIGANTSNLSYIVQVIINRILFIRICEARKIEEEGLLLSFKTKGFWDSFKTSSYFDFFDHYDGPLFERINSIHEIIIKDDVFNSLIQTLYYPSPYRFDVIPSKLLSDIYEVFLSKRLIIEDNKVKDVIKTEYSKTKGAVSTPQYIVQEIIRRTILKSKLQKEGIEQIFSLKILDIACGSGVFAIEAFDYIEDIFRELYIMSKNTDYDKYFFVTKNGEIILNLLGRKAVMDNCIFGVDIDPEAVEVTKMSLSLKVVDATENLESYYDIGIFGSKILNGIGNNIKCGNSLVGLDILESFPSIFDNEDEFIKTNAFDWVSDNGFKDVFEQNGGFDFIIGNPPYVEVKNYNEDLPYMHQYIKSKFSSAKNGKVDLAIPFIEKSINLLNDKGRLGFIVQSRFFKTEYGKKIREIITTSNYLSSIIGFESTSIFKDRITYVAILVLDKLSSNIFSFKYLKGNSEILPLQLRELETPEIANASYSYLPSNAFDANPWSFDDSDLVAMKTKLMALGYLGDYAKVKVGIQVLWDKAYHIRPISVENNLISGKSHIDNAIEIELEACRPLICNENFYPYRSDKADVYVLFPYEIIENEVSQILFTDFKTRFPKAGKYLEKHKELIQKNVETVQDTEGWHLYTRVQNHGAIYNKILVPMTALDTFATVSFSNKTYCDNANVFFIESPEKDEIGLYALSAIINSTIFSVLARSIANPQTNGYFKFNKQFLEPIPFPCAIFAADSELKQKLATSAKRIEQLQNLIITGSPVQKKGLEVLLARQWQRLDDFCYQLYKLTDDEKIFFSTRGRNVDRIKMLK